MSASCSCWLRLLADGYGALGTARWGRKAAYVATRRAKHDIDADLVEALAPRTTTHHAAITDPVKVGELLRAIDGYDDQPTTAAALRLAPHVFVRPTEFRAAEWSEMMLEGDHPDWRIPAERMKASSTQGKRLPASINMGAVSEKSASSMIIFAAKYDLALRRLAKR